MVSVFTGDSVTLFVLPQELVQIRKEEKAKKRRHLENISSLKGMGYSLRAARQALHQASGDLDAALKVRVDVVTLAAERPEGGRIGTRSTNAGISQGRSRQSRLFVLRTGRRLGAKVYPQLAGRIPGMVLWGPWSRCIPAR